VSDLATTRLIMELAGAHRVVTHQQLRSHGLSKSTIERRVAAGLLVVRHVGVYVVGGGAVDAETSWSAAIAACRAGTRLSHWDALARFGVGRRRGSDVHVTVPGRGGLKQVKGIKKRATAAFTDDEMAVVDGLPVTSFARTLFDMAPTLSVRDLEQTVVEAVDRDLYDGVVVERLLHRYRGRPGAPRIRELLDVFHRQGGARRTRSRAEIALLAMSDTYGLKTPRTNVEVHGYEVDAHWPNANLVVEVDGWQFHRTRAQREYDARKRLAIQRAGTPVIVLTWEQVTADARATAAALAPRVNV
jgi:predicted transcriptional regulator of viral defense system